jgi:hypothetical protein
MKVHAGLVTLLYMLAAKFLHSSSNRLRVNIDDNKNGDDDIGDS